MLAQEVARTIQNAPTQTLLIAGSSFEKSQTKKKTKRTAATKTVATTKRTMTATPSEHLPRTTHILHLRAEWLKEICQDFESFPGTMHPIHYQLSLIHPQLKTGTANQRHPFSPAATLLSRNSNGNRNINGTRNSEVV